VRARLIHINAVARRDRYLPAHYRTGPAFGCRVEGGKYLRKFSPLTSIVRGMAWQSATRPRRALATFDDCARTGGNGRVMFLRVRNVVTKKTSNETI